MSGMIRFLFNIVKAIVLLAIVAIFGGVVFFLSIRETIPNLSEPPAPVTREAAAEYDDEVMEAYQQKIMQLEFEKDQLQNHLDRALQDYRETRSPGWRRST